MYINKTRIWEKYFLNYTIFCQTVNSRDWKKWGPYGCLFGEPVCQRVGVDVRVCVCVSVRGTVQVGPNCEKGAKASWASVQCPLGPAELKEWGISSNPKTESQRKRGKSPAGLAAGHPATRLDYETLENSAVVEDERKEKACCSTPTTVQTSGQHFLRLSKTYKHSVWMRAIKTNDWNVESHLITPKTTYL